MKSLAPSFLVAAAFVGASSVASSQSFCQIETEVNVIGTVASVQQAPTAPFDGIAVGDAFRLDVRVANDVVCVGNYGNNGYIGTLECCEMTIGAATDQLDPFLTDPCIWGEEFVFAPSVFVESSRVDAPFGSGNVHAVLELEDLQNMVGIELNQIIQDTIFVPGVTAPGFSAQLTLQNAAGNVLAVIDIDEISGSPGITSGNYCTANPNASGVPASMGFQGSLAVSANDATLFAFSLPAQSFGYFLVSDTQGFIANPAGSAGNLCLAGAIGRFVGPGQIQNSGSAQLISLAIDVSTIPQPTGTTATLPGMTWNFTAWFREVTPGGVPTSNFADGLSLTFF